MTAYVVSEEDKARGAITGPLILEAMVAENDRLRAAGHAFHGCVPGSDDAPTVAPPPAELPAHYLGDGCGRVVGMRQQLLAELE